MMDNTLDEKRSIKTKVSELIESENTFSLETAKRISGINDKRGFKKLRKILKSLIKKGVIGYDKSRKLFFVNRKSKKLPIEDPRSDYELVVQRYKIETQFSEDALEETNYLPDGVREKEIENREDLRNEIIFTIDGEDAKDLDDAVSIKRTEDGGWILGVHIADVSHYVKPGTALDESAYSRATSIYLINKVIPMFPEKLSNGLCSLNPEEDKLTVSVFIKFSEKGVPEKVRFSQSVIRSVRRFSYEEVERILNGELSEKRDVEDALIEMNTLAYILRRERMKEGSIDFDFREQIVVLDDRDYPVKIYMKDRLNSERIIEEFMLAANRAVAEFLSERGVMLFRVHERPDEDKIIEFARLASRFGVKVRRLPRPSPLDLQKVLKKVSGKDFENFINHILLRSMKQAHYDTKNIGHYGLAFDYYTHFTSPIRRYPDLVVHRILKRTLSGKTVKKSSRVAPEGLKKVAKHTSKMERIAMSAERDIVKLKGVRYMLSRIGQEFKGIVSGFNRKGIFVELTDTGIEGLIPFSLIQEDYFVLSEDGYSATGRSTGKKFSIGDKLRVKVVNVNLKKAFVDFIIA